MTESVPNAALLDVGDLCRMFEESEDASLTARKDAERDRDYVNGKQLTSEKIAVSRALLCTGFAQPRFFRLLVQQISR